MGIASNLKISMGTAYIFKIFEATRKKVQHVAQQRCLEYRPSFVASVFTFSKEMFVWIDESGMKDILRQYGYALHGERSVHEY